MKNTFFHKGLMTLAVISGSALASIASAQAPSATDLGTLPRCLVTSSGQLTGPGGVVWFKFTLPSAGVDRSAGTFLDLDTEGTLITGGTFTNDTMLALFDGSGNFIAIDDDSGTNALSRLSFGLDTPARPAPGNGLTYAGGNGATLAGGDYYAAAFDYSGTRTVATPFTVTVQGTASGTINFRVLYGPILGGTSGAPTTFTNLGTLVSNGNFLTSTMSLSSGTPVRWFKFTLGAGVDTANRTFLDIDTEGTTGINNTAIALFNGSTGAIVAQDTASGTDNLSQLSFGFTNGRPAPGNGLPYNGRNGATVAAGDYYIAVAGAPASFSPNFGFATCTSANSSNVKLNVRTGTAPPPAPPSPLVRDFGTITGDASESNVAINSGEIKWFKVVLPDIPGLSGERRYLDIDTEGSSISGNNDTEVGIYNSLGTLRASDDDSGSGALSLLSFGSGSRPAVGGGGARTGQNGAIVAGTYYIAVAGYNAAFGIEYGVTTTSTDTGTVNLNLFFGTTPPVAPPTADADLGTVTAALSPRSTAQLQIDAATFKWVKFTTTGPTNATDKFVDIHTNGSSISAGTFGADDTEIGLYDAFGGFLNSNDDWDLVATPVVRLSCLTYGQTAPAREYGPILNVNGRTAAVLPAGTYYAAAGAYNIDFLAEFGAAATNTQTGTLVLTVATNIGGSAGCNPADITNLGGSGGPDNQLTVDDLIKYLSWFLTGDIRADLTNLGGTGPADGQLTADDLIKFLNLFLTAPGC
jgi:hypothetical protein